MGSPDSAVVASTRPARFSGRRARQARMDSALHRAGRRSPVLAREPPSILSAVHRYRDAQPGVSISSFDLAMMSYTGLLSAYTRHCLIKSPSTTASHAADVRHLFSAGSFPSAAIVPPAAPNTATRFALEKIFSRETQ